MESRKFQFLKAVLGTDGANALAKAVERAPALEPALLPRAIMAWLGVYGRDDYEGRIPGVEGTYLQFSLEKAGGHSVAAPAEGAHRALTYLVPPTVNMRKSEPTYSGSVAVGDGVYSFEAASLLHLGACIAVALGADHERVAPQLKDLDIQRLGKNIDTLVKARVAAAGLQKRTLDPGLGVTLSHEHHDLGDGEMLTHVRAHSPEGHVVGEALFSHHPSGSIIAEGVNVHPDHRRKGIASAIYGHAQKVTGKTVAPSDDQTPLGQALWQGNASQKQFGKSEHHWNTPEFKTWQLARQARRRQADGRLSRHQRGRVQGHGHGNTYVVFHPHQVKSATHNAGTYSPDEPDITKTALPAGKGKEGPGPAHAPTEPDGPVEPTPPDPTQDSKGPVVDVRPKPPVLPQPKNTQETVQTGPGIKQPKAKPIPSLKVTKSQAEHACGVCGSKQFRFERFTGCLCLRDLSKSVKTKITDSGYTLEFSADWDKDSMLTLIEALGVK